VASSKEQNKLYWKVDDSLRGVPNPSPKFMVDGYNYSEVGPTTFVGKGKEEMDIEVAEIIE